MKYTWAFYLFAAGLIALFVTSACQSKLPTEHFTHDHKGAN